MAHRLSGSYRVRNRGHWCRSKAYLLLPTGAGPLQLSGIQLGGWVGQSKDGERWIFLPVGGVRLVPLPVWQRSWSLNYCNHGFRFHVSLGRGDGNGTGGWNFRKFCWPLLRTLPLGWNWRNLRWFWLLPTWWGISVISIGRTCLRISWLPAGTDVAGARCMSSNVPPPLVFPTTLGGR